MVASLTPLDFARRARRLYSGCEAVIDENQRFTYEMFFERTDRRSAALQSLGVRPGDRVAYLAPNTHAQLESFYAVPTRAFGPISSSIAQVAAVSSTSCPTESASPSFRSSTPAKSTATFTLRSFSTSLTKSAEVYR